MSVVIGSGKNAKVFLPNSSASWNISGVVKKDDYDNILLLSYALHDQELIDIRRCFEETTHIFAFGRSMNNTILQVNLLMFLTNKCSGGKWATTRDVRDKYEAKRIYKLLDSLAITIDNITLNGFLVDMSIGDVDPSKNTCVITFSFILDEEV